MALNDVTLTGTLPGAAGAVALFTPSNWLTDATDELLIPPKPVRAVLSVNPDGSGSFSVSLLATDNPAPLPAGWYWSVIFAAIDGVAPEGFSFPLASSPSTQDISTLVPVIPVPPVIAYLPLPSGTALAGDVPVATGIGSQSAWGPGGGSGGGVNSVTAADGSVVVAGTGTNPTVRTGTLDAIAVAHPPAAAWSNNGKKITNVANGTAAQDAAAFGQLPSSGAPLPLTQGGTGQSQTTAASLLAALGALQVANNLSDLASAVTARTNLGLGSAATQPSSAFDAAGAAAAAAAASLPLTGGTMSGPIAMGTSKITGLGNGSAAQDAAAFGQLPSSGTPLPLGKGGTGLSEASNAALLAALGAAALAGATFTGAIVPAVATLTFGASIAVNAALANVFNLTLTASTGTLANPTNPADGQVIRVRVIQDATGSRTLAYGTAYDFGTAGAPTLSTGANKVDILGFEYVASLSKWVYLGAAFPQGF